MNEIENLSEFDHSSNHEMSTNDQRHHTFTKMRKIIQYFMKYAQDVDKRDILLEVFAIQDLAWFLF